MFWDFVLFLDGESLHALGQALEWNKTASAAVLQNQAKWTFLLRQHSLQDELQTAAVIQTYGDPVVNGCVAFQQFLNLAYQFAFFMDHVHVVQGDLGTITHVDGHAIDCLAFPTSAYMMDPGIGVATVVFRRAGRELAHFLSHAAQQRRGQGRATRRGGDVLATPAFGCGGHVKLLIHCVGPAYHAPQCDETLYKTYVNALLEVHKQPVAQRPKCVAFASISTGNLHYPAHEASVLAMQAVRDVLRTRQWTTRIAFVCLDKTTLPDFQRAKQHIAEAFNADCFAFPAVLNPDDFPQVRRP